jgi:hypothetical protein
MLLYHLYVIFLRTKIITENLKGRGLFFPLITKLASHASNFCHSANVGNGLFAAGWCGVKRSTDRRGSSVHESPSFVCLSVAKTPTIDEAMNVLPIG